MGNSEFEKKIKEQKEFIEKITKERDDEKNFNSYQFKERGELEKKNKELNKKLKEISEQNQIMQENLKNFEELQKKLDQHEENIKKDLRNKNIMIIKNESQIKKLNKSLEEFQNKDQENKKASEIYQKELNDLKKEHDQLIKQIEDEKDEKEKKELEEKSKIKGLKLSYENKLNMIQKKKISSIKETFDNNFCMEDILKLFNKDKIRLLINNSFKREKILDSIIFYLKVILQSTKNKIKNITHLNILLVGSTGVGKTTLINALLKLDLKADFGKPQTQKIEPFQSDEIPFLRLFDSKGIEKDPSVNIDYISGEISDYIQSIEDPDNFIHCIWYCWTGTRLENVEIQLFKKLSEQYTLDKLPIIIVYTNAVKPEKIKAAKEYIKGLALENDFIEILAKEEVTGVGDNVNIIPAFGLDKLIEISIEKAKSAVNSSCYEGILKTVRNEIEKIINNLVNILQEKLKKKIETIISEMGRKLNEKKLEEELNKLIIELFYYFFFLSPDIEVNEKNNYEAKTTNKDINNVNLRFNITDALINEIKNFVVESLNEFFEIYKKNYNQLEEKYKQDLLQEIESFRTKFILENGKVFEMKSSEEIEKHLRLFINLNISKFAEKIAIVNYIRNIIDPLVNEFALQFKILYQKTMTKEIFKNEAVGIIKISFDKIEQEIKKNKKCLNLLLLKKVKMRTLKIFSMIIISFKVKKKKNKNHRDSFFKFYSSLLIN